MALIGRRWCDQGIHLSSYGLFIRRSHPIISRCFSAASTAKDYYEILGLEKTCSSKDIRTKYVELCKKYHPDTISCSASESQINEQKKKFQEVQEAYNVLSKEIDRKDYDDSLKYGFNPSQSSSDPYAGFRTYQGKRGQYYYRDQAKEQAYYDWKNRRQSQDTDGWSWGDYYDDPWNERKRYEYYKRRKTMWEKEKDHWAKNAGFNDPQSQSMRNTRIVSICISVIIFSFFLEVLRAISLAGDSHRSERIRILNEVRKRKEQNMTEEEKLKYRFMTVENAKYFDVRHPLPKDL